MKRIVSFLLLLCMLSTACVVCAAESKSDFTEESWMMEPFSSKLVLNSSIVGERLVGVNLVVTRLIVFG